MHTYIPTYIPTYLPTHLHSSSCVIKAAKGRFHAVHLVADVLAGLVKWYEGLTLKLVDRIIEELTRGMEQAELKEKDPQVSQ